MLNNHYYCYSKQLHKYIQEKHHIKYVCAALHEKTLKKFWLYEKSDQLNNALQEYSNIMKQLHN